MTVVATRLAKEEAALRQVAARLHSRFPQRDLGDIERAVQLRYASFSHSRIRDFIPVLVERATREELARPRPDEHRVARS